MTNSIKAQNARIDIVDVIGNDNIILNIYYDMKPKGEYDQVILPRNLAKAMGLILQGKD